MCLISGALFAFFANAFVVLVAGLVTGRAGRLVPWWFAGIVLGFFSLAAVWALVLGIRNADWNALGVCFRVVPFVAVGWPAVGWLRSRQAKKA